MERLLGKLNAEQREAAERTEGPLLVIAGPGSGKTTTLVARTVNILVRGLAQPREILLCTYTDKAAGELRDRVAEALREVEYDGDLSELLIGTIHSVCNEFVQQYRHRTELSSNYEVLDELTQLLFLHEHFDGIVGPQEEDGKYLGYYTTRWTAIEGVRAYFDKITEELIDPQALLGDADALVQRIGRAYMAYEQALFEANRIDFAHQEKLFFELLDDDEVGPSVCERVRYVMVDEYQDTNYVQEQIVLRLAGKRRNVCVVGDDDQSLYRFRGATVRNILQFPQNFDGCPIIKLTVNYRSHEKIIAGYNRFMDSADWSNPDGLPFRYAKDIAPDPQGEYPDYPALFCIWGETERDEAERFADLVVYLRENEIVEDYSQIALLLHSVRQEYSGRYIEALARRNVPAFCPRARGYFDNEEVRGLVACLAVLLGWYGDGRGDVQGRVQAELAAYVDGCLRELGRQAGRYPGLQRELAMSAAQIESLQEGESLDWRLADFLYRLLAQEPFGGYLQDENRARNMATFSQLLTTFQNYYHHPVIYQSSRLAIRFQFFNSFLRLLHSGGINEYEDPDQPFPRGYVQIMTIHQSKGLEFPVVIVGSLAKQLGASKLLDRKLGAYFHRPPFEPESRVTQFDRMRLFYVAFSRAEKMLVLSTMEKPKPYFASIWGGLEQWPYVKLDLLKGRNFRLRNRMPVKKAFSFTADLRAYETCPRQYQMFRHYEFSPARSAELFFGSLVHGTIEEIHRWVLDRQHVKLIKAAIPELFENTFRNLVNRGMRPINEVQRRNAFEQVMNYFNQNQAEMRRVIETEVDVSLEKERYILTGKIDLLLGDDHKLELLDFKAQRRPAPNDPRLDAYYRQLCIYAHILEGRHGKRPDRLLLYWTGEPLKADALMVFPYQPELVDGAAEHFDTVVNKILGEDFTLHRPPDAHVCHDCDFRLYCIAQGTIPPSVLNVAAE